MCVQCTVGRTMLPALLLVLLLTPDLMLSAPRPDSSRRLRSGGLGLGKGWGLAGLKDLGSTTDNEDILGPQDLDVDKAVQHILSKNNTPLVRLFVNDHLFLHHLKLYLQRPSGRHLHQLENRAKTLRRRRTDEVSSRFFLRD